MRSLQIIESVGRANLIRLGHAIKFETKWMAWLEDQATRPVNYCLTLKGGSKTQVYHQSTHQNALQITYANGTSDYKGDIKVVVKYPHTLFEKGDGLMLSNEKATYRAEQNVLKKIKVEDLKGGPDFGQWSEIDVPICYVRRHRPDLLDLGCPPPPIERYTIVNLAREFGERYFLGDNLKMALCQYTDANHRRATDLLSTFNWIGDPIVVHKK